MGESGRCCLTLAFKNMGPSGKYNYWDALTGAGAGAGKLGKPNKSSRDQLLVNTHSPSHHIPIYHSEVTYTFHRLW